MKLIKRAIEKDIKTYLTRKKEKILFIWGPRRSGKTTLLEKISTKLSEPIFNFDYQSDQEKFLPRREILKKIAASHKTILIDEVQNYPQATVALKLLHDEFGTKIIATGSSELRRKDGEFDTLAGRYREIFCLPLSVFELAEDIKVPVDEETNWQKNVAEDLQIYGAYPEVYARSHAHGEKIDLLEKIVEAFILKDIISIYDLKSVKLAKDILTKIALQLGSEVSLRELAGSLSANVSTVSSYVEIFIKNYVLIPLPSFRTNLRRAVSEHRKLYFCDLGVRNALVKDFRPLRFRPDRGGVFENFVVSEAEKRRRILGAKVNFYFYREFGGKEVDFVAEDYQKRYRVAEIKTIPKVVNRVFPLPHQLLVINGDDYFEKIKQLI